MTTTGQIRKSSTESNEAAPRIPIRAAGWEGDLCAPVNATGIVVFAHGAGSNRHSPRNQFVATALREAGLATLLIDLISVDDDLVDPPMASVQLDVASLGDRLLAVIDWLAKKEETCHLPIGLFGSSAGAAVALVAAAQRPRLVGAVVSRGGRPDLAQEILPMVEAPTLLVVGGKDRTVIELNQRALMDLRCPKKLEIIPGAGHLFEEPGALEQVARLACDWLAAEL